MDNPSTEKRDLVIVGVKIPRELDIAVEVAVAHAQVTKQQFIEAALRAAIVVEEAKRAIPENRDAA